MGQIPALALVPAKDNMATTIETMEVAFTHRWILHTDCDDDEIRQCLLYARNLRISYSEKKIVANFYAYVGINSALQKLLGLHNLQVHITDGYGKVVEILKPKGIKVASHEINLDYRDNEIANHEVVWDYSDIEFEVT